MHQKSEIKNLQRQLAKAKASVRQTKMKVEDLEAAVDETLLLSERITLFSRQRTGKPVRVDKSANAGDFLTTWTDLQPT